MNPTDGMFLSKDPVLGVTGISTSYNPYTYVYANPINLTDPSGKIPLLLALPLLGAGVALIVNILSQTAANMERCKLDFFTAIHIANLDIGQAVRSALAGASIGAAFAVGFVFANPVVVGALTNVFGNLAAAAINGQAVDFGSLLIDAVIGGLFGGAYALVLGKAGLLSQVVLRSKNVMGQFVRIGSRQVAAGTLAQLARLSSRASSAGALNAAMGVVSRLTDGYSLEEAVNPGMLIGDFALGAIVTGTIDRLGRQVVGVRDTNIIGSMGPAVSWNASLETAVERIASGTTGVITNTNIVGSVMSVWESYQNMVAMINTYLNYQTK